MAEGVGCGNRRHHMAIAASKWGPGFAKFNELTGKYATFVAPGLATVCGTMHV